MIKQAFVIGRQVAEKLEVIAIHGGASKDHTWQELKRSSQIYTKLIIIDQQKNQEGYAVLKHGFKKARHEWVFYTDGDAQYQLKDLKLLTTTQMKTAADVVNGYKEERNDSLRRLWFGKFFQNLYWLLIHPPIRDIHCDFRLIRRSFLKSIKWTTSGSTIISELVLSLQKQKAVFFEVPVGHYQRQYGHSNYQLTQLTTQSLKELWWSLQFMYRIGKS